MGRPIDLAKRELIHQLFTTEVLVDGERGAATRVAKSLGLTLSNVHYHLRQLPTYQKLNGEPADGQKVWNVWKDELKRGSYGAQKRTARRLTLDKATVSFILRQEPAYERLLDEAPRFDPGSGACGPRVPKERIREVWRRHVRDKDIGLYGATRATMAELSVNKHQVTNVTRGMWVPRFNPAGENAFIITVPGQPRAYGDKPRAVRCAHVQGHLTSWVWVNTYPEGSESRHDSRREARDAIARRYI